MDAKNVKRWITELLEKIYSKRSTQVLRSGIINMSLDKNEQPTGGVVVNQTTLEQIAQVPTYNFTTSHVNLPNINFTISITIPDMILLRYNPLDYPGKLLLSRKTELNQSYLVNIFTGKLSNLYEQSESMPRYSYSLDTGLVANKETKIDTGYIFLIKEPSNEGFQSNVLSDIMTDAAYTASINNSVDIRLASYSTQNNPESAMYKEYCPLYDYNYANDTFTQILNMVQKYSTFFIPELRNEVLSNISNGLMSWAWSWYNSTSGYFRNDMKDTASVLELYGILEPYLSATNKFYLYDSLVALNSTINQYAYSHLENTTSQTNVVTTQLSYSTDSEEPTEFGIVF